MGDSGMHTCSKHKTCLFQYKIIGNEHMFTSLILLYLAGDQGERVLTILIPMCVLSGSHNCVPDTHVWLH